MSAFGSISADKLSRLLGTPACPVLIDVRIDEDIAANPSLIPGSVRQQAQHADQWASAYAGQELVIICHKGAKLSEGAAALCRLAGVPALSLEGGIVGWLDEARPTVPLSIIPDRPEGKGTLWVTRSRPKIDRIACPWLIRRFIDREARFLFVAPSEVLGVAERFGATPFDIESVFWSHRGETCTFDTMVDEFKLAIPALQHLARIVRAADTGALQAEPQAAGLLALSLGLSRLYADDLHQLEQGMQLYDALYRWCRDATEETHNWVNHTPKAAKKS